MIFNNNDNNASLYLFQKYFHIIFNLAFISFEIINFFQLIDVIRRINFNIHFFKFIFLNEFLNFAFSLKLFIIYHLKYILRNAL